MSGPTVFVVDDDAAVRRSLGRSLAARGYAVETFDSAEAFLAATGGTRSGCLVLDVRMPDLSGTELQTRLSRMGSHLPIIFVTGHGDIPMAVRALKRGAVDFLEKPYRLDVLVERIDEALRLDAGAQARLARAEHARVCLERLTDREREVFDLLTRGSNVSNKEIARALGISHRTVEVHRSRIMRKMAADSLAELIGLAALLGRDTSLDI